jgi:L-alanine-DL-glutamate epimerase-like enolase superfamily enzyme
MIISQMLCQVLRLGTTAQAAAGAQEVVLVRLRTKEGYEGVGETTAPPEIVKAIIDAPAGHGAACGLRELLLGENPIETERLWVKMRRHTQSYGRSSLALAAMSAVDVALWDLKGKHFNEPIFRLLGGRHHEQFDSYAAVPFGQDGSETQAMARRWIKSRYAGVKFSGGAFGKDEELDLELARGARAGVGDRSALMIDAGGAWDARTALKRAQSFAELRVAWLEEPLRPDDVEGYAWLRDRSPVPIAAGRSWFGREGFRPLLDRHALDVYQVGLSRCGFTDAAFIRGRVEEVGARLTNYCGPNPVSLAASVQWLSTCRDVPLIEDGVADSPMTHLVQERLLGDNCAVKVSDQPGLGINLNEDFIKENLVAESGR